jgi:hypothetical protein
MKVCGGGNEVVFFRGYNCICCLIVSVYVFVAILFLSGTPFAHLIRFTPYLIKD